MSQKIQVVITNFITSVYRSIRYLYHINYERIKYGAYMITYNPIKQGRRVYILANGPSLSSEVSELLKDKTFLSSDKVVTNFFYKSVFFEEIKPQYYCLADPGLYKPLNGIFKSLNDFVTWNMSLIIPLRYYYKVEPVVTNEHIQLIPITDLLFEGFESSRFSQYKKGNSVFSYVNVINMCLMYCLNIGYSYLYLYGVDHTFFTDLFVDEMNKLFFMDDHFYGKELCPITNCQGEFWRLQDYIYDKYLTFKEYDIIEAYAKFLGAKIINCTERSLIDSFTRLSQIKGENI